MSFGYDFEELHEVVEQTPVVQETVKDLSRALNRHHRERVKNNRKRYHNVGNGSPKSLGKMVKTPCLCSCCMCMSPRKLYGNSKVGLKISEIRKMDAMILGIGYGEGISNDEFDGFVGFGEG
ncbi:hypothetical protein BN79_048 [Yersinia phage phiR2-01]|uniref:Phage protein n=1 Tax=Yersinia phage phiR2-01 TaxID=1206557 RepID=I7K2M0_9CAUD|nr:hypothetical protein BN79_048 [Yersinia phage phiR2-01]CCI88476.1 hypothetical protein BN79_048 [Yersinia phage phiR2-01]